jgi:hypothetical protein
MTVAKGSSTSRSALNSKRPALSLVSHATAKRRHHYSVLALWHLLSLDAPSVAALWTFAIARAVGLDLPWTEPAAMFVAVWMLYASDRLLDARPLPNGHAPPELEERHRFHQRHRRAFLSMIIVAACALAVLLHLLDPRALHLYALLAALLSAWLLLIHARPVPSAASHRMPKELAVGIFFPAAVFIPTVARLPQLRLDLLPAALLFAAVCMLNCLFLYAWEHPGARTRAHWTTRWATNHLAILAILIASGSCALVGSSLFQALPASSLPLQHASTLLAGSTLLSSLLLLLLHELRRALKPVHLRALADLVLLTPALILPLAALLDK